MLLVLRDDIGRIEVACEWWCVDETGKINWKSGRHAYVGRIEVNPMMKMRKVMEQLGEEMVKEIPRLLQGYWERDDTGDRLHWVRREQLCEEVKSNV